MNLIQFTPISNQRENYSSLDGLRAYAAIGNCIYMLNLEQLLKAREHEVVVFAMNYPEILDTP